MPLLIKCPQCAHRFPKPTSIIESELRCPSCSQAIYTDMHFGKMNDAYICHAPQDALTANAVRETLERHGVHCWIASRNLMSGDNWVRAIMQAIDQSRLLVLVLSAHAQSSSQVFAEVSRAASHRLPIFVLQLDTLAPGSPLKNFLAASHIQKVRRGDIQSAVSALVAPLCHALGRDTNIRAPKGATASDRRSLFSGKRLVAFVSIVACLAAGGYAFTKLRARWLDPWTHSSGHANGVRHTPNFPGEPTPQSMGYKARPHVIEWREDQNGAGHLYADGGEVWGYGDLGEMLFIFVSPEEIPQDGPLPGIGSNLKIIVGLGPSDDEQVRNRLREFGYWYSNAFDEHDAFHIAGYVFSNPKKTYGFDEWEFEELLDILGEKGLDGFACVPQPPITEQNGVKDYGNCMLIRVATSPRPPAPNAEKTPAIPDDAAASDQSIESPAVDQMSGKRVYDDAYDDSNAQQW